MSRIYEALKKAEAEKQGTAQGYDGGDKNVPAESRVVAPVVELDSDLRFAGSAMSGAGVFSGAAAASAAEVPAARHRWAPSLASLPALLNHGPSVEQFRSLRSRLFEYRGQHSLKSILISSGLPQEGKSFIASNLAISLARHKNGKVLLIDGDMRRCTLHSLLGGLSQPGLPDYLSGKANASEVMQKADPGPSSQDVPSQVFQNLTFIAGGNSGDEAADLSGSPRFQELVSAADFEWVVIDSPPAIPVSDAVNLARGCDAVLLVAREGVTQFQDAQRAQREFQASRVLGFVLNAARTAPAAGPYYGYPSPDARKASE